MSTQTVGTSLVAFGLLMAIPFYFAGEETGWIALPILLVAVGCIIAIVGRKPEHPV